MSYVLILGEVAPYIFTIVVFLGLAVSRWKRRRDERKSTQKDAQDAVEEQMLEMEFAAQMGELEEKIVIEQAPAPEDGKEEGWWSDQSDLV